MRRADQANERYVTNYRLTVVGNTLGSTQSVMLRASLRSRVYDLVSKSRERRNPWECFLHRVVELWSSSVPGHGRRAVYCSESYTSLFVRF